MLLKNEMMRVLLLEMDVMQVEPLKICMLVKVVQRQERILAQSVLMALLQT